MEVSAVPADAHCKQLSARPQPNPGLAEVDEQSSDEDVEAPSGMPESTWQRKRRPEKELCEKATAAAVAALLPHLDSICRQQCTFDTNLVASAVVAQLAPRLQEHPRMVSSAVTSAVVDSLIPVLKLFQDGRTAPQHQLAPPHQLALEGKLNLELEKRIREPNTDATVEAPRLVFPCTPKLGDVEFPWSSGLPPSTHSHSAISTNSVSSQLVQVVNPDQQLQRAFVVNFRRLLDMLKVFNIIHELIKSTAIAALTLVVAGSVCQLAYSVVFVAVLLGLFGVHFTQYDTLDITEFKTMANLLEDDEGFWNGTPLVNPNSLLKALTLSHRGLRRKAVTFTFSFLCLVMWSLLFSEWGGWISLAETWAADVVVDGLYATLLLVGTAMLLLHITFEWLYSRETQSILPFGEGSKDCEVPSGYSWLGLPSMWFTTIEARNDLRLWVANSKRLRKGFSPPAIFPAEMAIFALDVNNGSRLKRALQHAKLYSRRNESFLTRKKSEGGQIRCVGEREEPEELCLELAFFDNQTGEFSQPDFPRV